MEDQSLIKEIRELNIVLTRLYKRQSIGYSFLGGVLSGLGSVMGATLVVAILVYFLRNVSLIPLIGSWFAQLAQYVLTVMGK